MKKLRLITTKYCGRNCEGCCNKDWDIENLPVIENFHDFDEIYITGGEPLLFPDKLLSLINKIKADGKAKIFVYGSNFSGIHKILPLIDGITFTLHVPDDIAKFYALDEQALPFQDKLSLRLNIFEGVDIPKMTHICKWKIKSGILWIKNCPLPDGEVLMRLPSLWNNSSNS